MLFISLIPQLLFRLAFEKREMSYYCSIVLYCMVLPSAAAIYLRSRSLKSSAADWPQHQVVP